MFVTQKSQYALRAIFELAKRNGQGPIKISQIAEAQAIPIRFLEVILGQLKGSGIVQSKRGYHGGYYLVKNPHEIKVSDVFSYLQDKFNSVSCVACEPNQKCPFKNGCAFLPMWQEVYDSMVGIYSNTTFQDLLNKEVQKENEMT